MKNLYVNGCSFTHGHRDHVTSFEGIEQPATFTWPALLQEETGCNLVNEAYSGGSNSRLVRRTCEYLSQVEDPENWVVILQFTSLERDEYFDSNRQIWIGNVNDYACFDDRSKHFNPKNIKIRSDSLFQNHVRAKVITSSISANVLKLAQQTLFLQTYLDKLGFKQILFTGLSQSCLINYYMEKHLNPGYDIDLRPKIENCVNFEVIKHLYDSIDTANFVEPLSHITRGYEEGSGDQHPNIEGHRIFSRYIIKQLDLRNWYE